MDPHSMPVGSKDRFEERALESAMREMRKLHVGPARRTLFDAPAVDTPAPSPTAAPPAATDGLYLHTHSFAAGGCGGACGGRAATGDG